MIENKELDEQYKTVEPTTVQQNANLNGAVAGNGLAKVAIGGVVGAVVGTLAAALADKKTANGINRTVKGAVDSVKGVAEGVASGLNDTVKGAGDALKDVASGLNDTLKNAPDAVKDVASDLNNGVKNAGDGFKSVASDLNDTVKNASDVASDLNDTVKNAPDKFTGVASAAKPSVQNTVNRIEDIEDTKPESDGESDQLLFKLYEERLVAQKKQVKTGEVAIGKHIETEVARISVPVMKERLIIERTPIDTATASPANEADFHPGELARLATYEETVDIHKQAVVREQISVRKEVEHDTFEAQEQIRREELDLDIQDGKDFNKTNP